MKKRFKKKDGNKINSLNLIYKRCHNKGVENKKWIPGVKLGLITNGFLGGIYRNIIVRHNNLMDWLIKFD